MLFCCNAFQVDELLGRSRKYASLFILIQQGRPQILDPRRFHVVIGLSKAVIVIEAGKKEEPGMLARRQSSATRCCMWLNTRGYQQMPSGMRCFWQKEGGHCPDPNLRDRSICKRSMRTLRGRCRWCKENCSKTCFAMGAAFLPAAFKHVPTGLPTVRNC